MGGLVDRGDAVRLDPHALGGVRGPFGALNWVDPGLPGSRCYFRVRNRVVGGMVVLYGVSVDRGGEWCGYVAWWWVWHWWDLLLWWEVAQAMRSR